MLPPHPEEAPNRASNEAEDTAHLRRAEEEDHQDALAQQQQLWDLFRPHKGEEFHAEVRELLHRIEEEDKTRDAAATTGAPFPELDTTVPAAPSIPEAPSPTLSSQSDKAVPRAIPKPSISSEQPPAVKGELSASSDAGAPGDALDAPLELSQESMSAPASPSEGHMSNLLANMHLARLLGPAGPVPLREEAGTPPLSPPQAAETTPPPPARSAYTQAASYAEARERQRDEQIRKLAATVDALDVESAAQCARLEALEGGMQRTEETLGRILAAVEGRDDRLAGIDNRVQGLTARIGVLPSAVQTRLRGDLAASHTRLTGMQAEVSSLRTSVEVLVGVLPSLEREVRTLRAGGARNANSVADALGTLEQRLALIEEGAGLDTMFDAIHAMNAAVGRSVALQEKMEAKGLDAVTARVEEAVAWFEERMEMSELGSFTARVEEAVGRLEEKMERSVGEESVKESQVEGVRMGEREQGAVAEATKADGDVSPVTTSSYPPTPSRTSSSEWEAL